MYLQSKSATNGIHTRLPGVADYCFESLMRMSLFIHVCVAKWLPTRLQIEPVFRLKGKCHVRDEDRLGAEAIAVD